MGKALSIIATVLVVGGGLVYLLSSSFGDSMVYYKTVDELFVERNRFEGRPVRINGTLEADSVRQKSGTDEYQFVLLKNGKRLTVAYEGVLPDAMQPGREVVVQGILEEGDTFAANEIMTKCPSKYEAEAASRNRP